MTDFQDAVRCWWDGENKRKEFADKVAFLPESETSRLAEACKCSVDKIQLYRRAGALHYKMVQHFETPEIDELWQGLTISHWFAAARFALSPEKTLEHLQFANNEKLSERNFRAHVDSVENKVPKWMRRFMRLSESVDSIVDNKDYMSELEPVHQVEVRDAIEEFRPAVTRLAERLQKVADARLQEIV